MKDKKNIRGNCLLLHDVATMRPMQSSLQYQIWQPVKFAAIWTRCVFLLPGLTFLPSYTSVEKKRCLVLRTGSQKPELKVQLKLKR